MTAESETVQALRRDVAHQIARYTDGLGLSQQAAAKVLQVPQPTLSKIVHGQTTGLSLELLLRIAVRAGLRMTLQTGRIPEEAGAFVSARQPFPRRVFLSNSTAAAHASQHQSLRELTPAERLEIFLEHNQLASEWREAGRRVQGQHLPQGSFSR
jgi:predicted XRE-type DNA-binding protein